MSWASHPTDQMPEAFSGRHRRRRRRLGGIIAGTVIVLAVLAAIAVPVAVGRSRTRPAVPAAGQALGASPAGRQASGTVADPLMAATAKVTGSPSTAPSGVDEFAAVLADVVARTNAQRAEHSCAAARIDAKLSTAAREHSVDMAFRQELSHTGADGSDPAVRIKRAGYNLAGGWAENVAAGYPTPEAVMTGWMNSKDHRDNILNCSLKAIGVGVARAANGQLYWTQDFGGR
jgi:uncharacterized protein YkwD